MNKQLQDRLKSAVDELNAALNAAFEGGYQMTVGSSYSNNPRTHATSVFVVSHCNYVTGDYTRREIR